MALTDFPFKWSSDEGKQFLADLLQKFPNREDVEVVLGEVGLPSYNLNMNLPVKFLWREVINELAARGSIAKLVESLKADRPAVRKPLVQCARVKGPYTHMPNYDLRLNHDLDEWQGAHPNCRILNVQLMVAGADPATRKEDLLIFFEEVS